MTVPVWASKLTRWYVEKLSLTTVFRTVWAWVVAMSMSFWLEV